MDTAEANRSVLSSRLLLQNVNQAKCEMQNIFLKALQ